jgi:hypothetical protein
MRGFADCFKANLAISSILKVANLPLSYKVFDAIKSLG